MALAEGSVDQEERDVIDVLRNWEFYEALSTVLVFTFETKPDKSLEMGHQIRESSVSEVEDPTRGTDKISVKHGLDRYSITRFGDGSLHAMLKEREDEKYHDAEEVRVLVRAER